MIDLSKNGNPFLPNKKVFSILNSIVPNVSKYPTSNSENIEKIIANWLRIKPENCCISNGTMEGMDVLLKCLNKKTIGLFDPTFWGITYNSDKNNYRIYKTELNSDYYISEQLADLATNADVVYICNPNNPTLADISKKDLLNIIKQYPNCHFIIDETVLQFDEKFGAKTLYKDVNKFSNLTVLLSVSKILSLPGLRIGLVITNSQMKEKIKQEKLLYSVNVFSEGLLENIKNLNLDLDSNRKKIKSNFMYFKQELMKEKMKNIIIKNGSFILVEFMDDIDTIELDKYLKEKNIFVSCMKLSYPTFNGNWIRISAGTKSNMKKLADEINKFICKK